MTIGTRLFGLGAMFAGIVAAQNPPQPSQLTEWAGLVERAGNLGEGGHYVEALALLRQAASLADPWGSGDVHAWVSYNLLGSAYQQAGFPAESIQCYRHEIAMIKGAVGTQNGSYVAALTNLGTAYSSGGDLASGEGILRSALQIQMTLADANPLQTATIQTRLAQALLNHGHFEEAERLIDASLPVLKTQGDPLDVAISINNLGLVRQWQHRYGEALDLVSSSISMVEQKYGPEHPLLLRPLMNLGVLYARAGRNDEAEAAFARAKSLCEKTLSPTHPSYVMLLANYAEFLKRAGEKSRAKAMEQQAHSLARDNGRRNGLGLTVDASAFTSH
jgi:tetratricopeptide (TPR) repeat protein